MADDGTIPKEKLGFLEGHRDDDGSSSESDDGGYSPPDRGGTGARAPNRTADSADAPGGSTDSGPAPSQSAGAPTPTDPVDDSTQQAGGGTTSPAEQQMSGGSGTSPSQSAGAPTPTDSVGQGQAEEAARQADAATPDAPYEFDASPNAAQRDQLRAAQEATREEIAESEEIDTQQEATAFRQAQYQTFEDLDIGEDLSVGTEQQGRTEVTRFELTGAGREAEVARREARAQATAANRLEQRLERQRNEELTPGEDFEAVPTGEGSIRAQFTEEYRQAQSPGQPAPPGLGPGERRVPRGGGVSAEEQLLNRLDAQTDTDLSREDVEFSRDGAEVTAQLTPGAARDLSQTGPERQFYGAVEEATGVEMTEQELAQGIEESIGLPGDAIRSTREEAADFIRGAAETASEGVDAVLDSAGQQADAIAQDADLVGASATVGVTGVGTGVGTGTSVGTGLGTGTGVGSGVGSISAAGAGTAGLAGAAVAIPALAAYGEVSNTESELPVPEEPQETINQGAEIDVPEQQDQTGEIAIPEEQEVTEVPVRDPFATSEVEVPDQQQQADPTTARTSPVGGQVQQEEGEETEDEDELGVPNDDPFVISDKRLYDPRRDFGEREDVSTPVDPISDESPSREDIGEGISGQGEAFEPARGDTVEENWQQYLEEQQSRQEQAERREVLQRDAVIGSGGLAGTVTEGILDSVYVAQQSPLEEEAEQERRGRGRERDALDEAVTSDVGQQPDEAGGLTEGGDQREDTAPTELIDDVVDQTSVEDEVVDETTNAEAVDEVTVNQPGLQTQTPTTYETANPPEYGTPPTYEYPTPTMTSTRDDLDLDPVGDEEPIGDVDDFTKRFEFGVASPDEVVGGVLDEGDEIDVGSVDGDLLEGF